MTSSLLFSAAAALVTSLAASLWAAIGATGMAPKAERHEGGRDIRTW